MKVCLTFDVEVWCNGWDDLDGNFPSCYERYVYGRSAAGEYALPKTLELLDRHGLHGIFFVEPLFSARFGARYLERIVSLIRSAGQEVQLHLHAEWANEIRPAIVSEPSRKRPHLFHCDPAEQAMLIGLGKRLLEAAGSGPITAFRAGSFGVNRASYVALRENGIRVDSSLAACFEHSGSDLRGAADFHSVSEIDGVTSHPMTVFRDGTGRIRPAQVGSCSAAELRDVLDDSARRGFDEVVLLSHNFEMLKVGRTERDPIVAMRFDSLCRHLAAERERLPTVGFPPAGPLPSELAAAAASRSPVLARSGVVATFGRHVEQAVRRIL